MSGKTQPDQTLNQRRSRQSPSLLTCFVPTPVPNVPSARPYGLHVVGQTIKNPQKPRSGLFPCDIHMGLAGVSSPHWDLIAVSHDSTVSRHRAFAALYRSMNEATWRLACHVCNGISGNRSPLVCTMVDRLQLQLHLTSSYVMNLGTYVLYLGLGLVV